MPLTSLAFRCFLSATAVAVPLVAGLLASGEAGPSSHARSSGLGAVAMVTSPSSNGELQGASDLMGSGVLLGDDEHVLTALHVVIDADGELVRDVEVRFDPSGSHDVAPRLALAARVVAIDEAMDLALLATPGHASLVGLGVDLTDDLHPSVSTSVTVAGYPEAGGDTLTVTRGHVAGRMLSGMLKLDARAWPGSSGGPVFDGEGRLLGLLARVSGEDGAPGADGWLAVAVPASQLTSFAAGAAEVAVVAPDRDFDYATDSGRKPANGPDVISGRAFEGELDGGASVGDHGDILPSAEEEWLGEEEGERPESLPLEEPAEGSLPHGWIDDIELE